MIAGEAGHVEIVDILRNSADSGIMDIEHMHEEGDGEFKNMILSIVVFINIIKFYEARWCN